MDQQPVAQWLGGIFGVLSQSRIARGVEERMQNEFGRKPYRVPRALLSARRYVVDEMVLARALHG